MSTYFMNSTLMKAARASDCSSGKFFNLRRFTRSRFEEQKEGGGGQLPYFFEASLMAFLREGDIARLRQRGFDEFIGGGFSANPFAAQIFEKLVNNPGKAWVALSWRQYLAWFAAAENYLSNPESLQSVSNWLR